MTDYERECMAVARRTLGTWGCAEREITRLERRNRWLLERLSNLIPTLRAQQITGMPHGTGTSDPVWNAVERMEKDREEAQAELSDNLDLIHHYDAVRRSVDEKMRVCLSDLQIQIIELRYRDGRSEDYVAGKLNYSRNGVQKQEYKALLKLSRRIESVCESML
jgi:tRNA(Met) C34 N-acetyltransferase TmcA